MKWNGFAQRGPCGDLVRLVAFGLLDLQRLGADRVGVGGVDEDRAVVVGEDVVVVADHRLAEPGGAEQLGAVGPAVAGGGGAGRSPAC